MVHKLFTDPNKEESANNFSLCICCMHNSIIAASPKKPKNNYEALDTTAAACDGARKKSQQQTGHSLPALTIEGPSMKQDHLTGHSQV